MADLFADRYEIVKELGRGGFGTVYLAHDIRLGSRPVALKVLHPSLSADPAVLRLFDRETGTLANLQHDHIVPVFDAGIWENRRYIAMAFVDGPSLAQVVKEGGAQAPEQVADWLRQAASALGYAHEQGVLHRDIKSANLLLDRQRGRIFISDFGLARAAEVSGGTSYADSIQTLLGTAAYRAPEVAKTGHTVSSDLYSLGVVAYELLAGRLPFQADDPLSLMVLHATEPVPPLPDNVPSDLAALVMQLLAKSPADRPASAKQISLPASLKPPLPICPPQIEIEPLSPGRIDFHPVEPVPTALEATREWYVAGMSRLRRNTLGVFKLTWTSLTGWANSSTGTAYILKWVVLVYPVIPLVFGVLVGLWVYWAPAVAVLELLAWAWQRMVSTIRSTRLHEHPTKASVVLTPKTASMASSTPLTIGQEYVITVSGTFAADLVGTQADAIGVVGHPGVPPYLVIDNQYRRPDVIVDASRHFYAFSYRGTGVPMGLHLFGIAALAELPEFGGALHIELKAGIPWAKKELNTIRVSVILIILFLLAVLLVVSYLAGSWN